MKNWIFLGLVVSVSASAEISPPDREITYSRGFQQAKRVATLENQQDIPSRAYWLSTRLVKNIKKLSYKETKAKKSKAPVSTEN